MTASDRETHLMPDRHTRWTACGVRLWLVASSMQSERVTCEKCLTHVRRVPS